MIRTPRQDLEEKLKDIEYAKEYGAAQAKAEFALALAQARQARGLTQEQLADKMAFRQPYIARLEGGDANPTLAAVGKLLAMLGVRLAMRTEPLSPITTLPWDAPNAHERETHAVESAAPLSFYFSGSTGTPDEANLVRVGAN